MKLPVKFTPQIVSSILLIPVITFNAVAWQERLSLVQRRDAVRIERATRERERREREADLRMLEKESRSPATRKSPELNLAQIKEDFMRIQFVNKDLAQILLSESPLDLKTVAKSAAEIKKRASRLMDNLALPEGDEGNENH